MLPFTRATACILRARGVAATGRIDKLTSAVFRQLSTVAEAQEEITTNSQESTAEEGPPKAISEDGRRQRSAPRFTHKNILLQNLGRLLDKDGPIFPNTVYRFLMGCGEEMYRETPQQKLQLVKDVWDKFVAKGFNMDVSHYNALLSTYISNGHDFNQLEFLAEMKHNEIQPNYITFVFLVRSYCAKGDMQGALKIVEYMNRENFPLTEILYTALIEGYGNAGNIDNALDVLSIMSENNCNAGLPTYTALLGCYALVGDMSGMDKLFQDIALQNLVPETATYLKIVDCLSKGGHQNLIPQILAMIKDKKELSKESQRVMQNMLARGDNAGALELFTFISGSESEDVDEEARIREFIGKLYNLRQPAEEFLKVMQFLEEKGLATDALGRSINYCYWRKDAYGALKILDEFFAAQKTVKVHYFYPIVKAMSDNKDFQGLKTVFTLLGKKKIFVDDSLIDFMKRGLDGVENLNELIVDLAKESGLTLPARTSKAVLQHAVSSDDLNTLLAVLPPISYRYILDGQNFMEIESLLKRAFDADKVSEVYKLLSEKNIVRIGSSIDRVLEHITSDTSEVDAKDAVKFVKELMEKGVKGIPSRVLSRALGVIYKEKLKDDFFEVVRLMKEHDIQADEHQYIQILKMSAYIGNSAAAHFCFEKIQESNITPNANMYANLISAYWADKARDDGLRGLNEEHMLRITDTFQTMKEKGLRPPEYVISTILIAYLAQQRIEEADEVSKEYGIGFQSLSVHNAYLRAYSLTGMMDDAEKLFDWMKNAEDGRRPTPHSYHNLMLGYRMKGDVDKVRELMTEMKDGGFEHVKLTNMELIRSHLENDDLTGALDSLEAIPDVEAYPHDVMYRRIMKDLKLSNQVDAVQRAKEIFTKQGAKSPSRKEMDSLHMFMLVRAGRTDEALELIKSEEWVGSLIEIKRLAEESRRDIKHLEELKSLFKDAGQPTYVFDHALLRFYGTTNNVDKALELYKEKIESGQEIAESFQNRLQDLLRANDKEIPAHPIPFGRRAYAYVMGVLTAYKKLL